jgi:hypothetical protein
MKKKNLIPAGGRCVWCAMLALAIACGENTAVVGVDRIELAPDESRALLVGPGGADSLRFTAVAMRSNGAPIPTAPITWSTSTPSYISVSNTGVVVARGPGVGIVHASSRGRSASALVLVSRVPIAALRIALDSLVLEVGPLGGATRVLSAVLRDSAGYRLTDRLVRWSSSDPSIIDVSANGTVTAVGVGRAYVHARADDYRDSSVVNVYATAGVPAGVDVAVVGAQWTQGVQTGEHEIPMLAGGRAAVVNVTTHATGSLPGTTVFALRLFDAFGVLTHSDTTSGVIESGSSNTNEPTVQFLVPSAHLRPGTRWEVVRDPEGLAADESAETDRFPPSGPAVLDLVTPPPLKLHFVPIVLTAHGNARGNVSAFLLDEYLQTVRTMMPHGAIEATVGDAVLTPQMFGTGTLGGDAEFWAGVVRAVDERRLADSIRPDAHWIGVVRPPSGFTWTNYGGFGFVPVDGDDIGPFTRTFAIVGLNWFARESATRELVAHELGHNLGRLHAPCGPAGTPDAQYPVAGGRIGEGAHNTWAWETGQATRAATVPTATADVMGYCAPVWISAYNYYGIVRFRGEQQVAMQAALRTAADRRRVLLVRGEVRGATVTIERAKVMETAVSRTTVGGDWSLAGRTAAGATLFELKFSLARHDHSDIARPFAVTVPLDEATEEQLATLHVAGPNGTAQRAYRD